MIKSALNFTGKLILNTLIAGVVIVLVFVAILLPFVCILWLLIHIGLNTDASVLPVLLIYIALAFGLISTLDGWQ